MAYDSDLHRIRQYLADAWQQDELARRYGPHALDHLRGQQPDPNEGSPEWRAAENRVDGHSLPIEGLTVDTQLHEGHLAHLPPRGGRAEIPSDFPADELVAEYDDGTTLTLGEMVGHPGGLSSAELQNRHAEWSSFQQEVRHLPRSEQEQRFNVELTWSDFARDHSQHSNDPLLTPIAAAALRSGHYELASSTGRERFNNDIANALHQLRTQPQDSRMQASTPFNDDDGRTEGVGSSYGDGASYRADARQSQGASPRSRAEKGEDMFDQLRDQQKRMGIY